MKRIIKLLCVSILAIALAGCTDARSKFYGTWKCTSVETNGVVFTEDTRSSYGYNWSEFCEDYLQFRNNGTMTIVLMGSSVDNNYTVKDSAATFGGIQVDLVSEGAITLLYDGTKMCFEKISSSQEKSYLSQISGVTFSN